MSVMPPFFWLESASLGFGEWSLPTNGLGPFCISMVALDEDSRQSEQAHSPRCGEERNMKGIP